METSRKTRFSTDKRKQRTGRAFQTDSLKLIIAIIAELLIFLLWFDGPPRERYEILVHIALPVCIVLPLINYRYLIVVPFIAFLPDVARALGIDISHSLVILPFVFAIGCAPFIRQPKTAIVAGYAVTAVWASHFIVDARKYATIGNVAGYPWSDLVLYALLLTVGGFLLVQVLRFGHHFEQNNFEPRDTSFNNQTPLRHDAPTSSRADGHAHSVGQGLRRSRRIHVTVPEEAGHRSKSSLGKSPSNLTNHNLQSGSDSFVVGNVTTKKALMSKIRHKKGI